MYGNIALLMSSQVTPVCLASRTRSSNLLETRSMLARIDFSSFEAAPVRLFNRSWIAGGASTVLISEHSFISIAVEWYTLGARTIAVRRPKSTAALQKHGWVAVPSVPPRPVLVYSFLTYFLVRRGICLVPRQSRGKRANPSFSGTSSALSVLQVDGAKTGVCAS